MRYNFLSAKLFLTSTIFISLLLTFSCSKKQENEFANLPLLTQQNEDPLAFLVEPSSIINNENKTINQQTSSVFDADYKDPKVWGEIKFSQKQTNLNIEQKSDYFDMLNRARKATFKNKFLPNDTQIGTLQNISASNNEDKRIVTIINNFFNTMKTGTLDTELTNIVLKEELPVISRQIARSTEYGPEISEVRIGKIIVDSPTSRNVNVRIIRNGTVQSRAKFLFYFTQQENQWFINAIEGEFNALNKPYENTGLFTPLGTTGITQGF